MQYTFPALARYQLRDYQQAIVEQALGFLRAGQSPLIEMATGTGKTVTVAALLNAYGQKALWMAHRVELVRQARGALELVAGQSIGMELPGLQSNGEQIVVASKDTIRVAKRLERLKQQGFKVLVIDECHHSEARTFKQIAQQLGCLVVGMSATPFRHDKRGLSTFDCATTPFRITTALNDGWLVPFVAKRIRITSMDLSGIEIVAGDLNQSQLRDLTLSDANLNAAVAAIKQHNEGRPTIGFCVAVDVAERMAQIHGEGAVAVSQRTGSETRKRIFADFGKSIRCIYNVGIATEGTDLPDAACLAMYRPTTSPGLFQQMLGRGTRPLAKLEQGSAEERKHAITNSAKPNCLVLDFVGNAGKHPVCTVACAFSSDRDVLVSVSEKLDTGEAFSAEEVVRDEQQRTAQRRAAREADVRLKYKITSEAEEIALIGLGGNEWAEVADLTGSVTPRQVSELRRLGVSSVPSTRAEARAAIVAARAKRGLCSPRMAARIKAWYPKQDVSNLSQKEARRMMLKRLQLMGKL